MTKYITKSFIKLNYMKAILLLVLLASAMTAETFLSTEE